MEATNQSEYKLWILYAAIMAVIVASAVVLGLFS